VISSAKHLSLNSSGIIASLESKKFLGLIGVHNLIIVETPDALLVCSKDKAQEIKNLVAELQKKKLKNLV
jgi:mannose-1-phosphate guanylyltransferase